MAKIIKRGYTGPRVKDTSTFIQKALWQHGDKYDYSRVHYVHGKQEVEILCPDHGPFLQKPVDHTNSAAGCVKCAGNYTPSLEEFIVISRSHHGTKYDYSHVSFKVLGEKVKIVCPHHGPFYQKAISHSRGSGCFQCRNDAISELHRKTKEVFVNDAIKVHGDTYDYSKVEYKSSLDEVRIICPHHGEFLVTPSTHLHSNGGCNMCKFGRKHRNYTKKMFIDEAKETHNMYYDYSKVVYRGCDTPVEIVCPEHGSFTQTPYIHLRGSGCVDCWYSKARNVYLSNTEEFVEKAESVHGDKYDYSRVVYSGNRGEVEIVCPIHGPFFQKPHGHLSGNGCTECAAMDRGWGADGYYGTDKPSNLYVITMSNDEETFVKIGLAKNFTDRLYHFKRETDYQVILKYFVEDVPANTLFKIEQDILHRSGFIRYKPGADFRGKTECIEYKHVNDVVKEVKKMQEFINV